MGSIKLTTFLMMWKIFLFSRHSRSKSSKIHAREMITILILTITWIIWDTIRNVVTLILRISIKLRLIKCMTHMPLITLQTHLMSIILLTIIILMSFMRKAMKSINWEEALISIILCKLGKILIVTKKISDYLKKFKELKNSYKYVN